VTVGFVCQYSDGLRQLLRVGGNEEDVLFFAAPGDEDRGRVLAPDHEGGRGGHVMDHE
jgi:hypothetical protein